MKFTNGCSSNGKKCDEMPSRVLPSARKYDELPVRVLQLMRTHNDVSSRVPSSGKVMCPAGSCCAPGNMMRRPNGCPSSKENSMECPIDSPT